MKKQMLGMLLIAAASLIVSCQKQIDLSVEEGQSSPNRSKTRTAAAYNATACETFCIDPAAPEYYYQTGSQSGLIGNRQKSLSYKIWNDLTHFYIEVTYARLPETSDGTSTVAVTVQGTTQTQVLNNQNKTLNPFVSRAKTYSFPLPAGWKACDLMNWSIVETVFDGGAAISTSGTYNLIGACVACEESFSYTNNGNGTYTFSYTAKEAMTDVPVVFTFAQSDKVIVTGLDGWDNNGQTYQKTMSFAACETKTWTVGLSPRCGGRGQENVNLWTDFKVGVDTDDYKASKKNENTPNIIGTCSGN